jgi:hypothetical protein
MNHLQFKSSLIHLHLQYASKYKTNLSNLKSRAVALLKTKWRINVN